MAAEHTSADITNPAGSSADEPLGAAAGGTDAQLTPSGAGAEPLADLSQLLREELAAGKQARWIVLVEVCAPGTTEPRERRAFVYPERVTFGRGEACDIHFGPEERLVSSLHAELVRGPGGYTLRDADSRNGLYLQSPDPPSDPSQGPSAEGQDADSHAIVPLQLTELSLDVAAAPTEITLGPTGPICRIRIGDVIPFADYLVTGRLGEGGMATVFVAQETTGLSRLVVLKLIAPSLLMSIDQKDAEAMLQEEARIAAQISHPNVVNIFRAGCYEGSHFIAMEYLRGVNLGSIQRQLARRRRRCPADLAAALLSQALLGLHAAHQATDAGGRSLGIVHRDFTPTNIVCSPDGDVKLIDFGVARAIGRNYLSATGQFVGKPSYASPEQIQRPKTLDRRSDVFAAGIILYELCMGTPLFWRDHDYATMAAVIGEPIPPLVGIPGRLAEIILSALSREPDGRPATAELLAEQLEQFVLAEGGRYLQRKNLAHGLRSLGVNLLAPTPCTLVGRPTLFPVSAAVPDPLPSGGPALPSRPADQATRREPINVVEPPTHLQLGGRGYRLAHCLQRSRPSTQSAHAVYALLPAEPLATESDRVAGASTYPELPLRLHLIGSAQFTAPLLEPSLSRLRTLVGKWHAVSGSRSPLGTLLTADLAWPAGPFALLLPSDPAELRLQALLLQPTLPFATRRALAYRLALALSDFAAWPHAPVHGELEPSQVVVLAAPPQEPRVWLQLPHQLAGLLGEPGLPGADGASDAAARGARYGAPECLRGAPPTQSSDVFAVAAMIFELLGGDLSQAAQAVGGGGRLPPLPPSSPVALALLDALGAALSPDPARRPIASELLRCLAIAAVPESPLRVPAAATPRELLVPEPGGSVGVELPAGGRLHLYCLRLDRLANKGPLPLPLDRVSGLLPAPVSVSLYRQTLAIELYTDSDPGQARSRLYPDGAQAGTARLFLTADGSAFELGSRTQNRLQRIEYQALADVADEIAELPTLALRLRLPRAFRTAFIWTRDLRSGDLHVCCAQLAE